MTTTRWRFAYLSNGEFHISEGYHTKRGATEARESLEGNGREVGVVEPYIVESIGGAYQFDVNQWVEYQPYDRGECMIGKIIARYSYQDRPCYVVEFRFELGGLTAENQDERPVWEGITLPIGEQFLRCAQHLGAVAKSVNASDSKSD